MSKRNKTRVVLEVEHGDLPMPDVSDGLSWQTYLTTSRIWTLDPSFRVTEISRETVKGPKTGRQEAFESRWHACLHAVGVGGVEAHDEHSRPDAEVNQFIADALQAEIDKMEDER